MNCEYMHLRCCAHIINLVVKDGLEDQNESIVKIRNAVRYVRSSPARLQKFKTCVEKEKIKCEKGLCLDVDTRWNSTYLMLEAAVQYRNAFARMVYEDLQYDHYFVYGDEEPFEVNTRRRKGKKKKIVGHPEEKDFDNVACFIEFLKLFYDVTIKISGSKYATSNLFFNELVRMQEAITKWCLSENALKQEMAKRMKEKFEKYWGNLDKTNFLLYVAVLLDPRYKRSFLIFCFGRLYGKGSTKCNSMLDNVMTKFKALFDHYKDCHSGCGNASSSPISTPLHEGDLEVDFEKFMEDEEQGGGGKSEIDIYLLDGREKNDEKFDVLGWWKINSLKFPILSQMAKHVLGMPSLYRCFGISL